MRTVPTDCIQTWLQDCLSAEEVADGYDTFPSGSSGGEVGLPSLNGHLNYNASKFITYYVVILCKKLYFFTKLQMVDDYR